MGCTRLASMISASFGKEVTWSRRVLCTHNNMHIFNLSGFITCYILILLLKMKTDPKKPLYINKIWFYSYNNSVSGSGIMGNFYSADPGPAVWSLQLQKSHIIRRLLKILSSLIVSVQLFLNVNSTIK